jgi:hypothetical protein
MGEERSLNAENVEKLKSHNFFDFRNIEQSYDELNIVYNYHIGRIINDLQSLRSEET